MNRRCLASYVGAFNARILEESGYRTREDILNAKIFDLMLIGSLSIDDVEDLILAFAKEAHPRLADRLDGLDDEDDEDKESGIRKIVKIYGLRDDERPNKKILALTVSDVLRFRPLTCERIEVLLDILENGTRRIEA